MQLDHPAGRALQDSDSNDELIASSSRSVRSFPSPAADMPFSSATTPQSTISSAEELTVKKGKKRASVPALPVPAQEPLKKKKKHNSNVFYCHQDHQPHDSTNVTILRCTADKPVGKPKAGSAQTLKKCTIAMCARCLKNRYGEDATAILSGGQAASWTCPSCRGLCNCSACRKKNGLEATGQLVKLAKEAGVASAADLLKIAPAAYGPAKRASGSISTNVAVAGKVAAQPLGAGSSPGKKKKKLKQAPASKQPKLPKETDANATDSSLSSLSPSCSSGPDKPRAASISAPLPPPVAKKPQPQPQPAKLPRPPRPPKPVPAPPTVALSSPYYPHPQLPCTSSLLARLNLREFFLRFLPLMPSLTLPTGSTRTSRSDPSAQSTAHHPLAANVLAALSNDVLWLWLDPAVDPAVEAVQLVLLQAIVELLLLSERTKHGGVLSREQVEVLKRLRDEVTDALAAAGGKGKGRENARERPWRSAREALEDSEWIGRGWEWRAEASGEEGDESELSSLESDEEEGGGNKRRGDETIGEERVALICGLIELAYSMEVVRNELGKGIDTARLETIELNKQKSKRRHDLADEKARLEATKPAKPGGGSGAASKAKMKEWRKGLEAVGRQIEESELESIKESWRIQYDLYLTTMSNRPRFSPAGSDALLNSYYLLSPPPSALLSSSSSATAAASANFPVDLDPKNEGIEYPLSWEVVVHGRRPADETKKQEKERGKGKGESTRQDEDVDGDAGDEWFVVRDPEAIDALAPWIEFTTKHAQYMYNSKLFARDNPSSASAEAAGGPPSKATLERARRRAEGCDTGELVERIRGFADCVRWVRETALDEKRLARVR
ncbi:hypothetical protein JCM1840_000866 [Sporobolomyces johnsonii]